MCLQSVSIVWGDESVTINVDIRVRTAVTTAVHEAIAAVGGVSGLRRTSMFPSSLKTDSFKMAA